MLVLTPLLAVARPQPAAAAGIVSDCTEAALRSALAGGGLVTFSCSDTIPIASQIEITEDTVIEGGGVVTLDGQGVTRLFHVTSGVELTLRGLTLTGAYTPEPGGAIVNDGTLTIESSVLTGNSLDDLGGAIHTSGVLAITASALTGNAATGGAWGGAIYNNGGVVTITASTLSGNSADFGGAIFDNTNTTLTITASTLSGNSAGFGGAIYNGGALTVTASTLAGNSARSGGAAIYTFGTLTLTASTLGGNSAGTFGGAVDNFGSAVLTANILSGSNLCNGSMTSNGYNVSSDATCNLTGAGDLQNANPLLGPLMNNGGPTETLLPQSGSPAIDRVPNAFCATLSAATNGRDQRGAPRPESAGLPCDSGSVEVQVTTYFCVGERSGSLRYFVTPNSCVRGESRLMQSAEGLYAFCIGDRSGSMRYLFNGDASCLRGELKLLLPQDGPITICVGERSRSVRYVPDAGQCNARGELAYMIINPAA
jgi:hypothetical protein